MSHVKRVRICWHFVDVSKSHVEIPVFPFREDACRSDDGEDSYRPAAAKAAAWLRFGERSIDKRAERMIGGPRKKVMISSDVLRHPATICGKRGTHVIAAALPMNRGLASRILESGGTRCCV